MLIANKVFATNQVGGIEDDNELIEKYGKLSKSQKLAKLEKKLSKSRNLPNFDIEENGPSFLTPDARMAFNYLRLAFTKALIL